MARATLAHALIQLTVHFPEALEELGSSPRETLERAMRLAEQAIALAPDQPDGHAALGRLILCHDEPESIADAIEVLEHALSLDAAHDPAQTALAVALAERGDTKKALEAVDQVLKRGNALPQPLLLRALLHLKSGHTDQARRDIERAVRLAPTAGLLWLDAAEVADALDDGEAATFQRQRAQELLGAAYERIVATHQPLTRK